MSVPMLVQASTIVLAIGWSAVFATHRLMPVASRRAQARVAHLFDRPALPMWIRSLARRMRPLGSGGGSCGDGCSSCGGCAAASAATKPGESLPLVFRPKK